MIFLILSLIPFNVQEGKNFLKLNYNGVLKDSTPLVLFYQFVSSDTNYSNIVRMRGTSAVIKFHKNPEYVRLIVEDRNGNRDMDGDNPYMYVFKKENAYLFAARVLLVSRKPDFEKAMEYVKLEEKNFPDNRWIEFYKWWIANGKGEKYQVPAVEGKDDVSLGLKVIKALSERKKWQGYFVELVKGYPESHCINDLINVLPVKELKGIVDFLNKQGVYSPFLPQMELEYLFSVYNPRDPNWVKELKRIVTQYPKFRNRTVAVYYLARMVKWDEAKPLLEEVTKKTESPDLKNLYASLLIQNGEEKRGIRMALKAIKIVKGDYIDRRYWNYDRKKRDALRKENLLRFNYTVALGYHSLGKDRKARVYIERAMENMARGEEDPDVLELAGDIYLKLNDKKKAENAYLRALSVVMIPQIKEKLKSLYTGDDFEAYLKNALKNLSRANMLNQEAPDFTVKKLSDGRDVKLSDFRGKVVELNFWATWCGPCIREIPFLNKLVDEYKGKDVVFLAVSDENPDAIKKFLEKQEFKYMQTVGEASRLYNVMGIPTHFVIDKKGMIQFKHVGYIPGLEDKVKEEIDILLGKD